MGQSEGSERGVGGGRDGTGGRNGGREESNEVEKSHCDFVSEILRSLFGLAIPPLHVAEDLDKLRGRERIRNWIRTSDKELHQILDKEAGPETGLKAKRTN